MLSNEHSEFARKIATDIDMGPLVQRVDVLVALEKELAGRPLADGSQRSMEQVHQGALLLFAEHAGHGLLSGLEGVTEALRDNLSTFSRDLRDNLNDVVDNLPLGRGSD